MSSAPQRYCAAPGCSELTTDGRCHAHQQQQKKRQWIAKDEHRENAYRRGYDRAWRAFVDSFRAGAGLDPSLPTFHVDLLARNRCTHCWERGIDERRGLEYDHITPLRQGGAKFAASNVQPLCRKCHARKTAMDALSATSPLVLVCGPPCSGKTTWAAEHRIPGQLVIDYDAIMQSLTGSSAYVEAAHFVTLAMCDSAVAECTQNRRPAIVLAGSAPRAMQLFDRAGQVVLLDPGRAECERRAATREDDGRALDGIAKWYGSPAAMMLSQRLSGVVNKGLSGAAQG